jgi:hypothetical protein
VRPNKASLSDFQKEAVDNWSKGCLSRKSLLHPESKPVVRIARKIAILLIDISEINVFITLD